MRICVARCLVAPTPENLAGSATATACGWCRSSFALGASLGDQLVYLGPRKLSVGFNFRFTSRADEVLHFLESCSAAKLVPAVRNELPRAR